MASRSRCYCFCLGGVDPSGRAQEASVMTDLLYPRSCSCASTIYAMCASYNTHRMAYVRMRIARSALSLSLLSVCTVATTLSSLCYTSTRHTHTRARETRMPVRRACTQAACRPAAPINQSIKGPHPHKATHGQGQGEAASQNPSTTTEGSKPYASQSAAGLGG